METPIHKAVLLHEVIEGLDIQPGDVIVDGTVGSGGHLSAFLEKYGKNVTLIGLDQDQDSIDRSRAGVPTATFFTANFRDIEKVLTDGGFQKVNKILFDLGWSSDQFETSGRGFSFQKDEPLQMTFKKEGALVTARDIVNTWQEETLSDILYGFGEERHARRIAKAIVTARETKPIETTTDLVAIIQAATPILYHHKKIHFATKTFQALRIAVNDEYRALQVGLQRAWNILAKGGRLAVISFHSGEDRIVKRFFKDRESKEEGVLIFKKPVTASREEKIDNRRSRSAKLRIIKKIT